MIASMNAQLNSFLPIARTDKLRVDTQMVVLAGLVLSVGIVMSASSSIGLNSVVEDNLHYLKRHLIYLVMGLTASCIVVNIPLRVWYVSGPLLLGVAVVLLTLVLVPFIGIEVKGSRRWIPLGIFNLQASEFAKVAFILFFAGYLVRRGGELRSHWHGFMKPLLILGVVAALLMAEPDFGSVVVLAGVTFGMMFLAGIPLATLGILAVGCAGLLSMFIVMEPYRVQRVLTYLDPWSDQFNSGYQLTQSLMAIGRGEWFGVGLGNSVQKLAYLPEAHTDFVFSILAEETGLVGAVAVLLLLAGLIARIFMIGRSACVRGELFGGYVAMGIAVLFSCQVFINIGVATGLLPTKGLTLPFISYGGSSLLVCMGMLALVARIAHENRLAYEHAERLGQGLEDDELLEGSYE